MQSADGSICTFSIFSGQRAFFWFSSPLSKTNAQHHLGAAAENRNIKITQMYALPSKMSLVKNNEKQYAFLVDTALLNLLVVTQFTRSFLSKRLCSVSTHARRCCQRKCLQTKIEIGISKNKQFSLDIILSSKRASYYQLQWYWLQVLSRRSEVQLWPEERKRSEINAIEITLLPCVSIIGLKLFCSAKRTRHILTPIIKR